MDSADKNLEARLWYEQKLARLPAARHWYTSVTGMIILLNVAVFLVLSGKFGAGWITTASMDPYIRFAASNASATTNGEWWRLLVSMFVHFGIIHLGMNMWALYNLGELMEQLSGKFLYALTYLACGLGGGFASMIWHGEKVWSAGASGAIFGVLGATLGYILRQKKALPPSVYQPILRSTLVFAAYNLFYGFAGKSIDNSNHVGGFMTGIAMGWLTALPLELDERRQLWTSRVIAAFIGLAVVIGIGYKFSPRFDFNLAEEYSFEQRFADLDADQAKLIERYQVALGAARENRDVDHGFEKFLQSEYIPFYQTQLKELSEVKLTPKLRTDRRREALARVARARVAAAQQLIASLQKHDPVEFHAFQETEKEVDRALQAIPE